MMIPEIPAIYFYLFMIALFSHIIFMEKWEEYDVCYSYTEANIELSKHNLVVRLNPLREVPNSVTFSRYAYDVYSNDHSVRGDAEFIITNWKRIDYGWKLKPFWKQLGA